MRKRRGVLGGIMRDCYENALIAKERRSIAGYNKISAAEDAKTTTTSAGAEILTADEDDDDNDGRGTGSKSKLKHSSTTTTARETPQQQQQQRALLWSWVVPLVYIFLILLMRGFFWIFSSLLLMATTERESKPPLLGPRVTRGLVNPCETGQDSQYCSSG